MTYVTASMRAALTEHRLRQVCNANGVRVFRMAEPGTFAVDLVFLPNRIGITRNCMFGSWSVEGFGLQWFCGSPDARAMHDAFRSDDEHAKLRFIQQRFAELYREREARIEAIVAGWEWHEADDAALPYAHLKTSYGEYTVAGQAGDDWQLWDASGNPSGSGAAADAQSARLAARVAVLRQAKEHPELWYCESPLGEEGPAGPSRGSP